MFKHKFILFVVQKRWITFWVAFPVLFLSAWFSIAYLYRPGVTDFYLPLALGLVLTYWYGYTALGVILVNNLLVGMLFWNHYGVELPLFALTEVSFSLLSYVLFVKIGKGDIRLSSRKEVVKFFLLGIIIPAFIDQVILQEVNVFTGHEEVSSNYWFELMVAMSGDFIPLISFSMPLLYFLSPPFLGHETETKPEGVRPKKIPYHETALFLTLMMGLTLSWDFHQTWFVNGIMVLFFSLRHGFAGALTGIVSVILSTVIVPAVFDMGTTLQDKEAIFIYFGDSLLIIFSVITGRTISDLVNAEELIRKIDREKINSQEAIIQLQQQQNEMLDIRVKERTWQLQEKNDEISAQNEELTQMAEELATQRDTVIDQKKVIEEQNLLLRQVKDLLEEKVRARTEELELANDELVEQNSQLEQFAFMTAHNIRSPIARLLGLTFLYENPQVSTEDFKKELIVRIKKEVEDLDHVVREIGDVLQIKKGTLGTFQTIDLHESLNKVILSLQHEILENNAVIRQGHGLPKEIRGIAPYVSSIFYNIISNSIKYRHPFHNPEINIGYEEMDDHLMIIFADNGIGLDTERFKEKLFKPFTRFHTHKEGRGLGLHLIKIQMEAMRGSVILESHPEKGMRTTLWFPK